MPNYTDPAYGAENNWRHVERYIPPQERAELLASLGYHEDEARADRFKSFALLQAWSNSFAARIRRNYDNQPPQNRTQAIARIIQMALELNLGKSNPPRTVPVRPRFGLRSGNRWVCILHSDSNTDPKQAWRVAWRFPHPLCLAEIAADIQAPSDLRLGWSNHAYFEENTLMDADAFRSSMPDIGTIWRPFTKSYCLWLEGLLARVREGFMPVFYWPGHDVSRLSATRLIGTDTEDTYPLPESPWR